MSVSFLQRVLTCLLWLGLGTIATPVPDVHAAVDLAVVDQTVVDQAATDVPIVSVLDGAAAQRHSACDGRVDADCMPAPQDRGDEADPMKRRHASRRVTLAQALPAPTFDVVPVWHGFALAAVDDDRTSRPSAGFAGATRTQRSALRRRQLRALRGRAPPHAFPAR